MLSEYEQAHLASMTFYCHLSAINLTHRESGGPDGFYPATPLGIGNELTGLYQSEPANMRVSLEGRFERQDDFATSHSIYIGDIPKCDTNRQCLNINWNNLVLCADQSHGDIDVLPDSKQRHRSMLMPYCKPW